MKLHPQTRVIVATAAALAVVDIAVRLMPMGRTNTVFGASSAGVVTAQEFRLVDRWGNERATMALDGNGEPGIKLFDRFGTERAQLDTFESTPSLILMDKNGMRRTYYGMDSDTGNSIVEMYGDNEQPLKTIRAEGGDMSPFTVNDSNDNRVTISASNMTVTTSPQENAVTTTDNN